MSLHGGEDGQHQVEQALGFRRIATIEGQPGDQLALIRYPPFGVFHMFPSAPQVGEGMHCDTFGEANRPYA